MVNPYIPSILALISVIIASYSLFLTLKTPEKLEEYANTTLNTLEEVLKETLEPVQKNISKSYSHKGQMGASVRQKQALDTRITRDIIDLQDPMIKAGLDMFPRAKEYVEKNPHLLVELLPRIQQLQQIEGFKPSDLISPPSSSSRSSSSHPFGMNEE